MLKEEDSCYSNQFSTCTDLALSSLIFSGFISSGWEAAHQVQAVLGSGGVCEEALGGPHSSAGPCLLTSPAGGCPAWRLALLSFCERATQATEEQAVCFPFLPPACGRSLLLSYPRADMPLVRRFTCTFFTVSQSHWDRFQPASGKRNWIQFCGFVCWLVFFAIACFCNSSRG